MLAGNVFQSKNVKGAVFLKNGWHRQQQTYKIDYNFFRWFVTEPKTYIKEKRKRGQWVRPWIRKRDSKRAYFLIASQDDG